MTKVMKKTGFTLIELMVTIAILALLLTAGIPGMRTLLDNMTVRSTTDQLANALNYARGQAVSRVANVSVCTNCYSSSIVDWSVDKWSDGWVVFLDENADGAYDVGEEVLRVEEISQSGAAITLSPDAEVVSFNNLGESTSDSDTTFTIKVGGANSRMIGINSIGTVSIN